LENALEKTQHLPVRPVENKGVSRIIKRLKGINRLCLFMVVLPTVIATLYYGLIASDVYISESRFVVRSPQHQSQTSVVGALLQSSGFSRAQDDTYPIIDFITSRDALLDLNKGGRIQAAYGKRDIDWLSRFPGMGSNESFEELLKYYQRSIVSISYDTAGAIATLRVSGFSSEDAQKINERLLELSENVVNRLNKRAEHDMVDFAEHEVSIARDHAKDAAIALSQFRNQRSVFDPEKQSTIGFQLVGKLQDQLIAAKGQLVQLRSVSPQNPQIQMVQARIGVIEREIDQASKSISGGSNSLSDKSVTYEQLALNREFADRQLTSALASLESARVEAQRQQLYLERVVQPNSPDKAMEPRRLKSIFEVFALGMILWGIASLLIAGVREHHE
jgi:capsular polysaccharide transport system permease protein